MHLLVAMVTTAPLAWRLDRLPLGRQPASTVPQLNLWILRWTADRLPHGLAGWWDAPIFWPQRGAFAFSEPQILTGTLLSALAPVVGPVTAYGLLVLAWLTLDGVAGAALARRLGAQPVPAALAGIATQTVPFLFAQLGVLQLLALWPVLLAITCLLAWSDEPRPRRAVGLGLALGAAILTCGYHALLGTVALAIAAPLLMRRSWLQDWRRRIVGPVLALGVAALTAPVIVGQQARLAGRTWLPETVRAGSAQWSDWAPSGPHWPGWILLTGGLAGVVVGWRRRQTWFLVTFVSVAIALSLGPRLTVAGTSPWEGLGEAVAGLDRLRSPFRAAALAQVGLVALAVPALERAWEARRRLLVRGVVMLLVVALVAGRDLGAGPMAAAPPDQPAWATWLADADDGAPVVALPFAPGPTEEDFALTTAFMVQALDTGHPLVNGYSGFFPDDHGELRRALVAFPDATSRRALRQRDVRYVVATRRWLGPTRSAALDRAGFTIRADDGDAVLFEVP